MTLRGLLLAASLVFSLFVHEGFCQNYFENANECGDTYMFRCLDYQWQQTSPLAWNSGDQTLPAECKSFDTTSTSTGKTITCISSTNAGNDNPCKPVVTDSETEITLENTFSVKESDVTGFVGDIPSLGLRCVYEKTQTLTTSLATYEAKDISIAGSGKFDVDLLPCGKLDDPSKLCTDEDIYRAGQATVARSGNLYFRSCVKGVSGASLYPVIRNCKSYDAAPPSNTTETILAEDYCGVKEFIDSAQSLTYKTKIFTATADQCSMVQVAAHKYAGTDNLVVVCTVTVCTSEQCSNLKALTGDTNAETCRVPWTAPPSDARRLSGVSIEGPSPMERRLQEEGTDYKSVEILTNAAAPSTAPTIGGTAEFSFEKAEDSNSGGFSLISQNIVNGLLMSLIVTLSTSLHRQM